MRSDPSPKTRRRIDLKTGFQCNNRCEFCVQGEKRNEYPNKTTEVLKKIIDEEREHADEIVFTGGEVTIRKDLPELVAHARDAGFQLIQIQTNGRMLAAEKILDRLIAAGATEFSPAIHGPNARIHDELTRAPDSFRQTVKGVVNVRKRGLPVLINSVITQANYRYLPEMARLFLRLGVSQYQFAFVHALGTAGENFETIVPRLSDAQPYVLAALEIGRLAGIPCMTEAIPLCFLPGYEAFAAEWIIPDTRIVDAEWVIESFTDQRLADGKLKGDVCKECSLNSVCEGPWREYPEHLGWDEFVPVKRQPAAETTL